MAEGLLKFFLQRLNSLVLRETQLFSGLDDQIQSLKLKLDQTGRLFEELDRKTEKNDDFVRNSVSKLREILHKMDDCVDGLIVQMDQQNGSDQTVLVALLKGELETTEASLGEMMKTMIEGEELPSALFKFKYSNLPYYLQSCLMYCCIFPEDHVISKGRLVRLLVAEGLVQEKPGEFIEDIAKENIEELVELRMIYVDGNKLKVQSQYRKLLLHQMEEEDFVVACTNSDTNVPSTARRVSIHSDTKNIPGNLDNLPIRSLFVFGIERFSDTEIDSIRPVFHGVKFLRVLDLEEIQVKSIPDEVGDLIHLRYLGLKNSNVDELPESVCKLPNLQTLDIRWNGQLATLSNGIVNLVKLRHLKMYKNSGVGGVRVPSGMAGLENLQTLTGVYVGGGVAAELGSLIQLRRLGVMDFAEDHANELYASMMNMGGLLSLSLEAKLVSFAGAPLPSLESWSPPPLLRKLHLQGRLETIPNWFRLLENLTKLRLGFSHLSENPGSLQLLPKLKHLTLWQATDTKQLGREFCGVGGFPKLEILVIASRELEEWTEIEEGAFPSLKSLNLRNCLKLRTLPEGLQHVTTLQNLELIPLLDELEQRLKPDGGEENYKIQHISSIRFMLSSVVRQKFEQSPMNRNRCQASPLLVSTFECSLFMNV